MDGYQAAEKQQENGSVRQPNGLSAGLANLVNTASVTTTSNPTVGSLENQLRDTDSKKVLVKATCSKAGTGLATEKLKLDSLAVGVSSVAHGQCPFQPPKRAKPPAKQASESQSRGKTSDGGTAPGAKVETDASLPISTKLAKGRACQKIGKPEEIGLRLVGEKRGQQPSVESSSVTGASLANGSALKDGYSRLLGSHAVAPMSTAATKTAVLSSAVSQLPNGLVATAAGKTHSSQSQVIRAAQRGDLSKSVTQLPTGNRPYANKYPAETSLLVHNGGDLQCGSKLTNGRSAGSADKKSRPTGNCLEQNGDVRVSKSSEPSTDQTSSVTSMLGEGPLENNDSANVAAMSKGKKTRRKGRGKEALSSVGKSFITNLVWHSVTISKCDTSPAFLLLS